MIGYDRLMRVLAGRKAKIEAYAEEIRTDDSPVADAYQEVLDELEIHLAPDLPPRVRALQLEDELQLKVTDLDARIAAAEKRVARTPGAPPRAALARLRRDRDELEGQADRLFGALHPPFIRGQQTGPDMSCRRCRRSDVFESVVQRHELVALCIPCRKERHEAQIKAANPDEIDQLIAEL